MTDSVTNPSRVRAVSIAGAATATSATAVIACGACCLLPLALPAVAASAAAGLLAWLAGAHLWLTALATLVVVAAWMWIGWQSLKRKARPARSTLGLMTVASLVLVVALAWPRIEAALMGWLL